LKQGSQIQKTLEKMMNRTTRYNYDLRERKR